MKSDMEKERRRGDKKDGEDRSVEETSSPRRRAYVVTANDVRNRLGEIFIGLRQGNVYFVRRKEWVVGVMLPLDEAVDLFAQYFPELSKLGFKFRISNNPLFDSPNEDYLGIALDDLKMPSPSVKKGGGVVS
ncbi:MAG: hypothetical protein QXH08_00120 [Candidatus Hadarchaeales archaeon]